MGLAWSAAERKSQPMFFMGDIIFLLGAFYSPVNLPIVTFISRVLKWYTRDIIITKRQTDMTPKNIEVFSKTIDCSFSLGRSGNIKSTRLIAP